MWHIEPGSKSFIEPVNPANPNRVDVVAPQRALGPDYDRQLQGLDVHRHRVDVRGAGHFWKKRSLGRHIHTNL